MGLREDRERWVSVQEFWREMCVLWIEDQEPSSPKVRHFARLTMEVMDPDYLAGLDEATIEYLDESTLYYAEHQE